MCVCGMYSSRTPDLPILTPYSCNYLIKEPRAHITWIQIFIIIFSSMITDCWKWIQLSHPRKRLKPTVTTKKHMLSFSCLHSQVHLRLKVLKYITSTTVEINFSWRFPLWNILRPTANYDSDRRWKRLQVDMVMLTFEIKKNGFRWL